MVGYDAKIAEYAEHYRNKAQAKEQFEQLLGLAKRRYSRNGESDQRILDVLGYVDSSCEYVIASEKNDALKRIVMLLDLHGKDIFNLENLLRIHEQKISRRGTGALNAKEVAKQLEVMIIGDFGDPGFPKTRLQVMGKRPRISTWHINALYR